MRKKKKKSHHHNEGENDAQPEAKEKNPQDE